MPPSAESSALAQPPKAAQDGPQIALAVDRFDWHARALTAAFARAGARAIPIRLSSCGFDTRRPSGLVIPGFGGRLPDAVFARAIGAGTFESVTTRLSVLHALGDIGVPVLNSARTIERCVDKAATSFYLAANAIPTPATWTVQTAAAARVIVRRECARGALVLKPLFGAQGRGLKLIRRESDLPEIEAVEGVYYLQRFVGVEQDGFRDTRVLVSRGEIIAAMSRHARHWITNVKLGAKPEPIEITDEMRDLSLRSAKAIGADFAGVDLLCERDGRLTVLEVNSMPGWRGLQSITGFSIADRLAGDLLTRLDLDLARTAR
ncbi:RimK family alpha-L-glutamate ligase [Methyloferula stellata]|uniref:RimK family alpha-L-glutamate ligase n=1 Tax=Methyloferula stellata TaxID=876270 RepID=UPI0003704846|nr:RimK family alpha-L-glutamate ligase [Methyloferula stellata]